MSGSSPRMWGIPFARATAGIGHRFIPTHVGNTLNYVSALSPLPVHPHACGEYTTDVTPGATYTGSSPRMWGIQWGLLFLLFSWRFIPTHVGNTSPA